MESIGCSVGGDMELLHGSRVSSHRYFSGNLCRANKISDIDFTDVLILKFHPPDGWMFCLFSDDALLHAHDRAPTPPLLARAGQLLSHGSVVHRQPMDD